MSSNHTSNHYFIGNMLSSLDARSLKNIKSMIGRKLNFPPEYNIEYVYTPFFYLGYFTETYEDKIKDLIQPIIKYLSDNLRQVKCDYIGYAITDKTSTKETFSLIYRSEDSQILKDVIPFMYDAYVLKTLKTDNFPEEKILQIPLFKLPKGTEKRLKNDFSTQDISYNGGIISVFNFGNVIPLPAKFTNKGTINKNNNSFAVNTIELLKATPENVQKGRQSFKGTQKLKIQSILSLPLKK